MKTFKELIAELKIVMRKRPQHHMTSAQKMKRKQAKRKLGNVSRVGGIARQKIVGGKKVARSSAEIQKIKKRQRTTVTKVKKSGGIKARR